MNSSPRPSTSCHRPTLIYDWSHLTCWTLLTHWPRPSSAMPDNFTSLAPPHSPSPASSSIYSCSCPRSFIPRSYASLLTSSNLTTLLKHYSLHHCPPSTVLQSILLASLKACLDFYQFQLACRNISALTLKIKKISYFSLFNLHPPSLSNSPRTSGFHPRHSFSIVPILWKVVHLSSPIADFLILFLPFWTYKRIILRRTACPNNYVIPQRRPLNSWIQIETVMRVLIDVYFTFPNSCKKKNI